MATAEGRIVGPDGKLFAHATTTCLIFDHPADSLQGFSCIKPDNRAVRAGRTPIGTYGGALKDIPATELGAAVIRECLTGRAGARSVETVVMGNVIQAGNKMNPARQAAIGGGIPV